MIPGRRKNPQVTNEKLKEALKECKGIYSAASKWIARNMGISFSRQGIAKRIAASPDLQEFVAEVQEETLDWAESLLLQQLKDKNTTALIFYLKTKGKGRGYNDRHEIVGPSDGAPQDIRIEFVKAEDGKEKE